MISAGSVVSTGAIQAGVDPEVAHAAGAVANIVSQNYVGAVWEVAQLAGHLTGILGGEKGAVIKFEGNQQGDFWAGRPVKLSPQQINEIKNTANNGGPMSAEQLAEWGAVMVARGLYTPQEVTAMLGVAPSVQPAVQPAQQNSVFGIEVQAPHDPLAQFWKGKLDAAMPPAAVVPPPTAQDLMRASMTAEGYNEQQIAASIAAYDADQNRISQLVAQGHAPESATVIMVAEKEAQAAAASLAVQQAEEKRVNDLLAQGNSFGNAVAIVAAQNAAAAGVDDTAIAFSSMG